MSGGKPERFRGDGTAGGEDFARRLNNLDAWAPGHLSIERTPKTDAEPGRRWLDWIIYAGFFGLGAGVVWLVGRWG